MNTYTTQTRIVFSTPEAAANFIHFLDRAESEMSESDFGPGWLGNILSMFGCLNVGFCECNGTITGLEVINPNIIEITTDSVRGPQIGPLIFLALLVDRIATISYISYGADGNISTNRKDLNGDQNGINDFFPNNNLLDMIEWCANHHLSPNH